MRVNTAVPAFRAQLIREACFKRRLTSDQFSMAELQAIVEEAEACDTYVCAHVSSGWFGTCFAFETRFESYSAENAPCICNFNDH